MDNKKTISMYTILQLEHSNHNKMFIIKGGEEIMEGHLSKRRRMFNPLYFHEKKIVSTILFPSTYDRGVGDLFELF